jgi:hypothetical protein
VTPDVGKRAPFELLAFTAASVASGLVVVEIEGRFTTQNGRFTRQPVLVVEPSGDRPRLELAPTRATRDDGRWRGVYAIPAEAMPDARLALGVRGTLLELPAPDEPGDTDRLSALAREANSLRRALEAAEADVATARAEADATAADLGARDGALAASSHRIATLETELAEALRRAAEQVTAAREHADGARAEAIAAQEDAVAEARARADAAERRVTDAEQRATDAEARARTAKKAARAAEAGTEVLRAELAEERERSRSAIAEAPDATAVRRAASRSGRRNPTADPIAPASPRTTQPRDPTAPATPHRTPARSPTHWIAVGALVLFAFVLLGLLAGFLG